MKSFSSGEVDILVSTTVIEVGVNVPNAALMVIENAERFGLSQLHQLRGRVGRGKHKSYCVLMSPVIKGQLADGNNPSEKRFKIMCENESGFKISQYDLEMRGPGDFFGRRQHGELSFKIADLAADMALIEETKKLADEITKNKRKA
jgi:ATP-dependent DNA helicase RecG